MQCFFTEILTNSTQTVENLGTNTQAFYKSFDALILNCKRSQLFDFTLGKLKQATSVMFGLNLPKS